MVCHLYLLLKPTCLIPPLFVYGTYTVSGVSSLSSFVVVVVVLLVLFLSLSLIEWKLSEGRGFGLFHS